MWSGKYVDIKINIIKVYSISEILSSFSASRDLASVWSYAILVTRYFELLTLLS